MRILTLASIRGAPGVTTSALLLASTRADAVVVEADLDGGVLAIRYGLGREPGLTTLAAAELADRDGWRAHAQDAGGVPVLVGPDAPSACAAFWRTAGDRLTQKLTVADGLAVVDAGRVRSPSSIVSASDLVLLLVNPVAEHLVGVAHILPALRQRVRGQLAIVLVGEGPYRSADVEQSLEAVVLGELPDDRDTAGALRNGSGTKATVNRSRLARAVTALSVDVHAALEQPVEVVAS